MAVHILVINDDQDTVEMLDFFLTQKGFEVGTSVEPVIPARYELRPPDLIVLDWIFGGVARGMDVLDHIRLQPSLVLVPVIVCSAAGSLFERAEASIRALGADILHKPFELDDLDAAITAALAG